MNAAADGNREGGVFMSFKLASIETSKGPRAALIVGDHVVEVAAVSGREEDRSTRDILADWAANLPRLDAIAKEAASKGKPLSSVKLAAPIAPARITATTPPKWPRNPASPRRPIRTRSACARGTF